MRFCLLLAAAGAAFAHDPVTTKLTWSGEISRIIYHRCAGCHREGASTPMPLIAYDQARPWAKAIRDEVLARRMPPWGAVKGFGEFEDDLSLTQDEINRIAQWVEGGAPEGDPRYLPSKPLPPTFNQQTVSGTRLRNPGKLARAVELIAIAPVADVSSGKVFAKRPDGTIEPLLWLMNYRARWKRTFVYRQALLLPAGTAIVGNVPVELVVRLRKPVR